MVHDKVLGKSVRVAEALDHRVHEASVAVVLDAVNRRALVLEVLLAVEGIEVEVVRVR